MYTHSINESTELRSIQSPCGTALYEVLEANRAHVARWHPWVNTIHSAQDAERMVLSWQAMNVNRQGHFNGIWRDGRLVGMVNFAFFDWANHWAAMSYWLAEAEQGRGLMTGCCRALIAYGFESLHLNRITIESAVDNPRSRHVPERLGFTSEGVVRQVEWLGDRHVDHAIYGLLRSEWRR